MAARTVADAEEWAGPFPEFEVPGAGLLGLTFMTGCIDAIGLAHHPLNGRQQFLILKRLHNMPVSPLLLSPEFVALVAF